MALQNLRSSTANKRPVATSLSDGQIAINTNAASPGIFFKNSSNVLTKVGPIQIGTSAPNSSPAGSAGNAVGEQWLDTSGSTVVLKVWDGSAWQQQNKFSAVAGTAAAPSYSFSGDPDTGIYSPGADQVAVATNGTGRLFVDANGFVGIGAVNNGSTGAQLFTTTTSSTARLIVASTNAAGYPGLRVANGTGNWEMQVDGANQGLRWLDDGNERLRITSAGLVGVGTSSPSGNLHVYNPATTSADIYLENTDGYYNFKLNNQNLDIFEGATSRLRIASGGNVGIGSSTPSTILHIEKDTSSGAVGTYPEIRLDNDDANGRSEITFYDGATKRYGIFCYNGDGDLRFNKSSGETARMDTSGRLLVGTSTALDTGSNSLLQVLHDSGPRIFLSNGQVSSNELLGAIVFGAAEGGGYDAASVAAYAEDDFNPNDYPSRLVFSTTSDSASSPTERMRIGSNGYVYYGNQTGTNPAATGATGLTIRPDPLFSIAAASNSCMNVGRNTNDGVLINFYQAGTAEGNISVSGTTVSYNGAHLARWSQLASGAERTEILRGSVLSNLDEMCEWGEEDNEQLNRMQVSDVEGDKNVSGVFQAWDDDDDTYVNDFYCAMTGDFVIRIAQGTTVARGDLLMSAGDGTAKPQDDDIIRSKTIAKVTSTNVSETYADGSYCVPCVLMAC